MDSVTEKRYHEAASTCRSRTRRRRDYASLRPVKIEEDRFGFEPEITAKIAKSGARIHEVGISYRGRTYAEGKKIGWKDGFHAIWCVFKYNLFR